MKKRVAFIAIILVLAATAALYAATKPPQVGGTLPEMKLQNREFLKS